VSIDGFFERDEALALRAPTAPFSVSKLSLDPEDVVDLGELRMPGAGEGALSFRARKKGPGRSAEGSKAEGAGAVLRRMVG